MHPLLFLFSIRFVKKSAGFFAFFLFGYYQTDFYHEIIVTAQAVLLFETMVKSGSVDILARN
jgi:hypothetical protein